MLYARLIGIIRDDSRASSSSRYDTSFWLWPSSGGSFFHPQRYISPFYQITKNTKLDGAKLKWRVFQIFVKKRNPIDKEKDERLGKWLFMRVRHMTLNSVAPLGDIEKNHERARVQREKKKNGEERKTPWERWERESPARAESVCSVNNHPSDMRDKTFPAALALCVCFAAAAACLTRLTLIRVSSKQANTTVFYSFKFEFCLNFVSNIFHDNSFAPFFVCFFYYFGIFS